MQWRIYTPGVNLALAGGINGVVYHPYLNDQSTIDDLIKDCDPNVHTIRWIAITFMVTRCEIENRIQLLAS